MLANVLALAVGLGSLALYMVAFFFPEVHRKNDFIWSGIGLFYALILWFCAGRITGAVLLGQMASVALLGWFGWQTFILRRQLTPVLEQTKISTKQSLAEKSAKLNNPFTKKKDKTQKSSTPPTQTTPTPESDITETATAPATELVGTPIQETEVAAVPNLTGEVKPVTTETETETETESTSLQTLSDASPENAESEVAQTIAETTPETETETNDEIQQITTPEKTQTTSSKKESKKGGGFSQLLTPVSGLLSNIKNVIQTRDSKKTDSPSTTTPPETEKSTSIEEVISKTDEPVTKIQENLSEDEFATEIENTAISDIQTEAVTFVEVEENTTPSSEAKSTSTEEVFSEQMDIEEVEKVEVETVEASKTDSPSSTEITAEDSESEPEKSESFLSEQKTETAVESSKIDSPSSTEITAKDSESEAEKSESFSSEQKTEIDDLPSESSKDKKQNSDS